ncbi:MAG: hypothetical protein RBG13Loki_2152 [Promethearchaeota archaeon CR_4]|nr:MAG: hypothetical protein RBG13Loki_2152 [Candidatus Lokiarchaeota archaeon CR_4]
MGIVYLIGKSLFTSCSIETFLQTCKLQNQKGQTSTLIFLQDGVIVAQLGNVIESQLIDLKQAGVNIFFRKEDLLARGIQDQHTSPAGESVTMKKIMEMLAAATSIVSLL